jgi:AsmA protein
VNKVLKVGLIVIGALAALVLAAVIVLVLFVDPNDIKSEVTQAVKEQTGRELLIEGDVSFSFFPWLGFKVGGVSLSNAQGFQQELMFSTEGAGVSIKILPLLSLQVVMDTIYLDKPVIHLEKNKDGVTNLDDIMQKVQSAEDTAAPAETPPAPGEEGPPPAIDISIGGVRITDGLFSYDDRQAGSSLAVEELNVKTGAVGTGEFFDLAVSFIFKEKAQGLTSMFDLASQVMLDTNQQQYAFQDLNVKIDLEGASIPSGAMTLTAKSNIQADLEQQTASIADLVVEVLGLQLAGQIDATKIMGDPAFTGNVKLAPFNAKELMKTLDMPPIETADPAALTKISADIGLSGTTNSVAVKPILVTLDDTNIRGEAAVRDLAKQSYAFDLNVDAVNADRYMPPKKEGEAAGREPEAPKEQAAEKPDLSPLREVTLDGKALVETLTFGGLDITDILTIISIKGGVLKVDPFSAQVQDGSIKAHVSVDARTDTPVISIREDCKGLPIGPLMKGATGEDTITGTAASQGTLTMRGLDPEMIKKTLNGDLSFMVRNGAIKGMNIAKTIRDASAKLTLKATSEDDVRKTDFGELSGSIVFTDGLAANDDFNMKSPLMRLVGNGEIDLPKESLDYNLQAKIAATLEGQDGQGLEDLAGLTIPLRITGTFDNPNVVPDMKALFESMLTKDLSMPGAGDLGLDAKVLEDLKKAPEKVLEDVGKNLEGDVKDVGKGLLKELTAPEKGGEDSQGTKPQLEQKPEELLKKLPGGIFGKE